MKNNNNLIIDYGNIPLEKQLKMDQKAYQKYYHNTYDDFIDIDDPFNIDIENNTLSFNEWYGTRLHQAGIQALLRRKKIEKINKKSNFL